jgi:hypothetical protein
MEVLRYEQQEKKARATNRIPSPSPRPTAILLVPELGLGFAVVLKRFGK